MAKRKDLADFDFGDPDPVPGGDLVGGGDPPPFDYTPIGGGPIEQVPTNPINFTPIDLTSLPGGSDSALGQLLRGLGFVGSNGQINPMSLLSALGPVLGGILTNRATSHATDQMLQANRDAMDYLKGQMGSGAALFKPYTDAGGPAIANLQGMHSNLASNFGPLGDARGLPGATPFSGQSFADIMTAQKARKP